MSDHILRVRKDKIKINLIVSSKNIYIEFKKCVK